MAWLKIASTKVNPGNTGLTAAVSPTMNTTGANLLVAYVTSLTSAGTVTFTDSLGNTWTAATVRSNAAVAKVQPYYSYGANLSAVGPGHYFSVSSAGSTLASIHVEAFYSSNGTVAFDQDTGAVKTDNATFIDGGSLTAGANNALHVIGCEHPGAGAPSINSSFNQEETDTYIVNQGWGISTGWKEKITAGAENPRVSWSSNVNAYSAISHMTFTEAAPGADTIGIIDTFLANAIIPVDNQTSAVPLAYATVPIAFKWDSTGTLPDAAELQVETSGGSVLQAWFSPQSAPTWSRSPSVGTWRIPIVSGGVKFKIRTKASGSVVATSSAMSTTIEGVGYLINGIGQSNFQQMVDNVSSPPSALTGSRVLSHDGTWSTPAGNGARVLCNALITALGPIGLGGTNCPAGISRTAIGGAGWITDGGSGGTFYTAGKFWNNSYANGYPFLKYRGTAGHVRMFQDTTNRPPNFLVFLGGESDAYSGTNSYAQMLAGVEGTRVLIDTFHGVSTTQLPVFVVVNTTDTSGATAQDNTQWTDLRKTMMAFAAETNCYGAASIVACTHVDRFHLTTDTAGYHRQALRIAQSILKYLGLASYDAYSLSIASVTGDHRTKSLLCNITGVGATALKNSSGSGTAGTLTGWEYSNDNFATTEPISAYAFTTSADGTLQVRLTLATNPWNGGKLRYLRGFNPTVTNVVYDDVVGLDSIGRELLPTPDPLTVTVPPLTRRGMPGLRLGLGLA